MHKAKTDEANEITKENGNIIASHSTLIAFRCQRRQYKGNSGQM